MRIFGLFHILYVILLLLRYLCVYVNAIQTCASNKSTIYLYIYISICVCIMCNIGGGRTPARIPHASISALSFVIEYLPISALSRHPPLLIQNSNNGPGVYTRNSCRLPARTISTAAMLLLSEISCTREALHVGRRRRLITHSDISSSNSNSSILRLVIHSLSLSLLFSNLPIINSIDNHL